MTPRQVQPWQILRSRGTWWSCLPTRRWTSISISRGIDEHGRRASLADSFPRLQLVRNAERQAHRQSHDRLRALGSVITTDNPRTTTLSQILGCFEALAPHALQNALRAVVVLVTPSFSELAVSPDFSKQVLQTLFASQWRRDQLQVTFHVITSVVDRLPRALDKFSVSPPNTVIRRQKQATRLDGHEGVAYTVVHDFAVNPVPQSASLGRHGGVGTEDAIRSLSLTVRSHMPSEHDSMEQQQMKTANRRGNLTGEFGDVTFQVPLHDTLFQTGHAQTMMHFEWEKSTDDDEPSLVRMEHIQMTEAVLDIRIACEKGKHRPHIDIAAGLVPLTLPQRVHTAMGNVIRELSDPLDLSKIFPASQQLEKSVTSYFQALATPPRAIAAWALIIPEAQYRWWADRDDPLGLTEYPLDSQLKITKDSDLAGLWKSSISAWQDRILTVVAEGGRLVKVLSGGGGWGKRAGLLSLDYQTSFTPVGQEDLDTELSEVPAFMSSPEAAKPGELVQFLIADDQVVENESNDSKDSLQFPALEFGTIPSTADEVPSYVIEPEIHRPARLHVSRGYFGALAEKGIAFAQINHLGEECWTKIDVPHSRIVMSIVPGPVTKERYVGQEAVTNSTPGESHGQLSSPLDEYYMAGEEGERVQAKSKSAFKEQSAGSLAVQGGPPGQHHDKEPQHFGPESSHGDIFYSPQQPRLQAREQTPRQVQRQARWISRPSGASRAHTTLSMQPLGRTQPVSSSALSRSVGWRDEDIRAAKGEGHSGTLDPRVTFDLCTPSSVSEPEGASRNMTHSRAHQQIKQNWDQHGLSEHNQDKPTRVMRLGLGTKPRLRIRKHRIADFRVIKHPTRIGLVRWVTWPLPLDANKVKASTEGNSSQNSKDVTKPDPGPAGSVPSLRYPVHSPTATAYPNDSDRLWDATAEQILRDCDNGSSVPTVIPEALDSNILTTARDLEQGVSKEGTNGIASNPRSLDCVTQRQQKSEQIQRSGSLDDFSTNLEDSAEQGDSRVNPKDGQLSIVYFLTDPQTKIRDFLRQAARHLRALNISKLAARLEELLEADMIRFPASWMHKLKLRNSRTGPQAFARSLATKMGYLPPNNMLSNPRQQSMVSVRKHVLGEERSAERRRPMNRFSNMTYARGNGSRPAKAQVLGNWGTATVEIGGVELLEAPSSRVKGRPPGSALETATSESPSVEIGGAEPLAVATVSRTPSVYESQGQTIVRKQLARPKDLIRAVWYSGNLRKDGLVARRVVATPASEKRKYTDPVLAELADAVSELLRQC